MDFYFPRCTIFLNLLSGRADLWHPTWKGILRSKKVGSAACYIPILTIHDADECVQVWESSAVRNIKLFKIAYPSVFQTHCRSVDGMWNMCSILLHFFTDRSLEISVWRTSINFLDFKFGIIFKSGRIFRHHPRIFHFLLSPDPALRPSIRSCFWGNHFPSRIWDNLPPLFLGDSLGFWSTSIALLDWDLLSLACC